MCVAVFDALCDRLTIRNLRFTDVNFNAVCTFQNVDLDIQMQLTHTFQDGFARIFICFNLEGWIFLNHLTDRDTEFFCCGFVFWLNRNRDNWIREDHRLKCGWVFRIRQCVTGLDVLHTQNSNDIASLCAIEFDSLIGMHFHDTTDTFCFASEGVEDSITFVQTT